MPNNLSAKTYDGQYDVKAYGAKGDNSTDDTAAVQAALTAAYTAGGGVVHFPPGTYLNSDTWVIKEKVHIRCDVGVTIKRTVDAFGYLLQNGDDSDNKTVYTGHGNISVTGGVWDMQGASLTTSAAAFAFGHAENISFDSVTIKDVPSNHAMDLCALKMVRLKNCRFMGFRLGAGDATTLEAVQIDLAKSGSFPPFGTADDTPSLNVVVEGCYFGTSGTAGTTSWARGVGTHTSTDGNNHMDIVIRDNKFDGTLDTAVPLFACERVIVEGNTFVSCGAGVVVSSMTNQDLRNISITGNNFYNLGTVQAAITVDPGTTAFVTNVNVSNNNIDGSTTGTAAKGINIWDSTNVTITGNTVSGMGDTGIRVSSCANAIIGNNTVTNPQRHGIQVSGGTDIMVANNHIKGASRLTNVTYYGIAVDSTCVGFALSRNRVRKFGSGNEVLKGIVVSNTCSAGSIINNDIQDTGLDDQGTSQATGTGRPAAARFSTGSPTGWETTTSTSYTNLSTTGPAVSLYTGTKAIVILSTGMFNDTINHWPLMSYAVSGATTQAADDEHATGQRMATASNTNQVSYVDYLDTLTPGLNTFTAKYRATGGTASFSRRVLTVIPLDL